MILRETPMAIQQWSGQTFQTMVFLESRNFASMCGTVESAHSLSPHSSQAGLRNHLVPHVIESLSEPYDNPGHTLKPILKSKNNGKETSAASQQYLGPELGQAANHS